MLKKSLSQNLLKDKNLLDKMVRMAGITRDDTVVEIGAGHGDLTRALAMHAGFVQAVELDQRFRVLLEPLEGELGNVRMTFGSILCIPLDTLVSKPVKVMGNIPYHITGDILFKLLYERQLVISVYLTMQREVAERLVASPHTRAYGALSAIFQLAAEVKVLLYLKPGIFVPPPKVESAYIAIRFRTEQDVSRELVEFIKHCFRYKRKYLKRTLEERYGAERTAMVYERMGFAASVRAEELPPPSFREMHGLIG